MATAINCKNDCNNTKMVSDATAVFDITAMMVEIVEVDRSLVSSCCQRFPFGIDSRSRANLVMSLNS